MDSPLDSKRWSRYSSTGRAMKSSSIGPNSSEGWVCVTLAKRGIENATERRCPGLHERFMPPTTRPRLAAARRSRTAWLGERTSSLGTNSAGSTTAYEPESTSTKPGSCTAKSEPVHPISWPDRDNSKRTYENKTENIDPALNGQHRSPAVTPGRSPSKQ